MPLGLQGECLLRHENHSYRKTKPQCCYGMEEQNGFRQFHMELRNSFEIWYLRCIRLSRKPLHGPIYKMICTLVIF